MASCIHSDLLQVVPNKAPILRDTDRLDRAIAELPNPSKQRPSLIFFIGDRYKDEALQGLFPLNGRRRGRRDGIASLRLDRSTIDSDYPILYADSNPKTKCFTQDGPVKCHSHVTHPIRWCLPLERKLWDIIHARLLFIFTDVICLFADDLGGLQHVASRLKTWAAIGSASSSSKQFRPRVVIVTTKSIVSSTNEVLSRESLQFSLLHGGGPDINGSFSDVLLLPLGDDSLSMGAKLIQLKKTCLRHAEEMREIRLAQKFLFTANHLSSLYHQAVQHTANTLIQPFDILQASRHRNPVTTDFSDHLELFLRLGRQFKVPYDAMATHIASSILMDAYPPSMHQFGALDVFRTLYKGHCSRALEASHDKSAYLESASDQCQLIEDHLDSMITSIGVDFQSTVQLHQHTLKTHEQWWTWFRSNKTCLACLNGKPEHTMTCGHAICDNCIRKFGIEVSTHEYRFQIDRCMLCSSGNILASVKPPSAGYTILSIDGGGVRGVIPLEFLHRLQRIIGPDCAVQDLFDVAFGTSSGGLIVLGLFLQRWSVARCIQTFDKMTRKFFHRPNQKTQSILTRCRYLLRCWVSDGYYNVTALEECLQNTFGAHQYLFSHFNTVSGTKVAVTASTISDASCYIFSNYNGIGKRQSECGYKHVRPHNVKDEPFVWQAYSLSSGRATSAAPVLFKPTQIPNIGTFQDGGLRHNNPVNLALWESRIIWPSVIQPDLVLSLGTGTGVSVSPTAPNFRHVFQDGFMPRLCRSFLSSLDGQGAWRDLVNHLDEESRKDYIRLNISFPGEIPAIDDEDQMESLRQSVNLQFPLEQDDMDTVFALLVSRFFFELDGEPQLTATGLYRCEGTIRCRLPAKPMADALMAVSQDTCSFLLGTETLGLVDWDDDVCGQCHRYRKHIAFYVNNLSDSVLILLKSVSQIPRKLSAFPQSMGWFIEQQGLKSVFGTADHGVPGKFCCAVCSARSNVCKRRQTFDIPAAKRLKASQNSLE